MRKKLINLTTTIFLLLINFPSAFAGVDVNQGHKHFDRTSLKCYVQLLGGRDYIYRLDAFDPNPDHLTQSLLGVKVELALSSQAEIIYKVLECLPAKHPFISSHARQLERNNSY
jgi:hypothetical protein